MLNCLSINQMIKTKIHNVISFKPNITVHYVLLEINYIIKNI